MRILVVEDNSDNAELLRLILEPFGEVELAVDGLEALEKLCHSMERESTYDLVLLDVRMPRMDGIETLGKLREEEKARGISILQRTKVIMITAYADEEAMQQAFQLGCEGYLFKTQGKEKIVDRLRALGLIEQ